MDTKREQCLKILKKYWGYSQFRPLQYEIIESVLEKRDTLALLPTGGGKSITYQVPALFNEGLCIVVTPLIALMKDQVEKLKQKQIKAVAVYSGLSWEEINIALDNCLYGDYKFLYCSPERLGTDIFRSRIQQMKVNLIAVDEAHCISMWGYDFRPSYLKIAQLRELLPNVNVLALTATATPEVAEDIMISLRFKEKNILQKSFERKNIVYVVRETEDKKSQLVKIFQSIKGSGIVYVRNRNKTAEIADFLKKNNLSADFYHAGLSITDRDLKQEAWQRNRTRIMVATNAFGMGIDKPDVRAVVHFDLPDSLESYYQEAGRAGRDEQKAYAVLLYNKNDRLSVEKRIESNFPDIKTIKNIYNALGNYLQIPYGGGKYMAYDFDLYDFAATYRLNLQTAYSSLKILEQQGYIELTDELNNPSKIHFLVGRDDLYKFQVANIAFDGFIKLLLRSYEGLFTSYVNISEETLAKRANISIDDVYKYINKLKTAGIINYIPRKTNPVIIYTEERLEDKALYIGYEQYMQRKKIYTDKIEAMLHYAESNLHCRSEIILHYFGEKNTVRCGQCDICLRRNELDMSKYEFDLIVDELKKILHGQPTSLESIIEQLKSRYPSEKVIRLVRWLLDNGKIIHHDDNTLSWRHTAS
ncbi:MAG: RecQ family ATP-dependent DNA helicase [Bacteroidales bacterium]|nr:RecQ family ATP-dependent DNA helicase [Bacteroidales bacterium]